MIKRNARQAVRAAVDALESRTLFATVVGLTSTDQLVTFDTATPGTVSTPVDVTGLATSETLLGIDFRPATGQLFGLGSAGQLYTINATSGAATEVGTPLAVTGATFGFDFNPQVDRIRVVSGADQNLRIVPDTGALVGGAADANLAYATGDDNAGDNPNVAAAAYDNNVASTGSTTLYVIDTTLNTLATQGSAAGVTPIVSPNTGQLFTVGELGVNATDVAAFDIAEGDGVAYAALVPSGESSSTLHTVNLTTGAATPVAAVGSDLTLKGLAAVPVQRTLFALADDGTAFARINPANLANPTLVDITGLTTGQTLTSIDFRPATGQLFGSTAGGQLYTINPTNGAAVALGDGFTPALTGDISDIDFNPTVDAIRVITDLDQNARANPDTGALVDSDTSADGVQLDSQLLYDADDEGNGTDPTVFAAAYTNSVEGATATTLYGLDAARDVLVSIGSVEGAGTTVSPNTGRLFTVGELGVDVGSGGFDIANDGPAFALVNAVGGTGSQLYSVNTATGVATPIGTVGDGTQVFADLAVGNSVISVTPATQNVAENAGDATITVARNGVADGPASVSFALVTPSGAGVTPATAGTDFGTAGTTTFSGLVDFADGERSKTITVPLINDSDDEENETLIVGLTGVSGADLGATVQATVVITDDDGPGTGGEGTVTVATDPVRTTGRATQVLTVVGTGGDDIIVVQPSGRDVAVTLNGNALGTPTTSRGLYRVVVFGGGGDDQIRLNSRLKFPGELHGEAGDDLLVGSKGRDLLIGGDGTDALYGRGGDDILIGGISDFTANPTATAALLNVFLAKGSFATRANAVSTGAGVNSFVFSSDTIDDDDDRDFLAGEGKTDLFLTKSNDIIVDESVGGGVVRNV